MASMRIVVAGAGGRMGQALTGAISRSQDCALAGALKRGDEAAPLLMRADVLIDFSTPESAVALAKLCAQAGLAAVIGTTGFSERQNGEIAEAARKIPIVQSGNMSLGVTLLAALANRAAKTLPDFDIEILEMHHRHKADAPSGTAILLGKAAAEGRGSALPDIGMRQPKSGVRKDGAIGFSSLRGGTVVGEHEVIFAGPHERLVLKHIAEDRAIFASGALAAARWVKGKKPGLYSMADVLGL